jgi:hypothetical protein
MQNPNPCDHALILADNVAGAPRATCSLVARVESIEVSLSVTVRQMRSLRWQLSLIVAAVAAVSPHLVAFGEWSLSHLSPSLLVSYLF